jgi:hypothetical protein
VRTHDLTYDKYGTRIAGPDETNDGTGVQQFAYDGTRAMLNGTGWEILPGPVERRPVGTYDGEDIYAYLWPIIFTQDEE